MTVPARLAAALVVATAAAVIPWRSHASCMEPPPIMEHLGQAENIFVGTVEDVANMDRTAEVSVQEIWAGADLPDRVRVHGGPDDPQLATSADQHYVAGRQYLFAVSARDSRLEDDSCTATRPWTDELAALRPDEVRAPLPAAGSDAGHGLPTALLVALVGAAIVGVVGIVAFRGRA